MIVAHKIALSPNNVQATYFAKAAGTARFAYNWALAEWQRQYAAWKADNSLSKPTQASLRRQLNAIKGEQFPWMLEVTKNAPQMAIMQLGDAFKNFFAGRAKYPRFRKKGVRDRFALTNDKFRVKDSRIRIPHIGWVRMRESLRFTGKIMSATVSRVADRWFPSSKTCSTCGRVQKKMPLSRRKWICPDCGSTHDRDLNAARNLEAYAVSSTVSACGEEGAGRACKSTVKPASVKQEFSTKPVQKRLIRFR